MASEEGLGEDRMLARPALVRDLSCLSSHPADRLTAGDVSSVTSSTDAAVSTSVAA